MVTTNNNKENLYRHMEEKTCCFIGHRIINDKEIVEIFLRDFIKQLIKTGFTRFIFGSKGEFNSICLYVVTELKKEYPKINRTAYLTKGYDGIKQWYEEVCKPEFIYVSGKAVYVERNQYMIDKSDLCVFYYNKDYKPPVKILSKKYINKMYSSDKSGTEIAYKYAQKKKKDMINIFEKI